LKAINESKSFSLSRFNTALKRPSHTEYFRENFNNLFIEEKLEKIEFVLRYLGFSKPDF